MRYGYRYNFNMERKLKNYRYRARLKQRRLGKPFETYLGYPGWSSMLYVPPKWRFVILTNLHSTSCHQRVYFYHATYYFNFFIPAHVWQTRCNLGTNTIHFYHPYAPTFYLHGLSKLQNLFMLFSQVFFAKLKFKGKGYYIYKNHRNTIAPQFGYAHRVYVYSQTASVRFLSKTKILLFGLSKQDVLTTGWDLIRVKPMNIFTGRGIRFARQVVYKKTGKVSSYR